MTTWRRSEQKWIGLSLIILQFFVPFFLLLSQNLKRDPHKIIWIAAFMMLMRWVDLYWLIIPNFPDTRGRLVFSWMNIAAMAGVGGLWLFLFLRNLRARPRGRSISPDSVELSRR